MKRRSRAAQAADMGEHEWPYVLFKLFVIIPLSVVAVILFFKWYLQPARWQITNADIERFRMKPEQATSPQGHHAK